MKLPWPRISDPGLTYLKAAARAAIVMPAAFAVAFKLIGQPQAAIFAPFGSFAMLVLADFSGPRRSRFTAYASLALIGAVFVVLGTLCSRNAWLAAAAMAVVGFTVLFSGVINGYFAAGGTAAILIFVLPVAVPAPASQIGWRLAGWGLASVAGIAAQMLLWPPPARSGTFRGDAARACHLIADLAELTHLGGTGGDDSAGRAQIEARAAAADKAIGAVHDRLAATHRSTGPSGQAAALAALIDELGWLRDSLFAIAMVHRDGLPETEPAAAGLPGADVCTASADEAMAAATAVLRASGDLLAGLDAHPDTERLSRAQNAMARALTGQLAQLPLTPGETAVDTLLGRLFRTRAITYTTRQIAGYAAAASGATHPLRPALRQFAAEHGSLRSVWVRNSLRAAVGLGIAVFIAQRSGLQHSFWVVLGTLSVLRSNALGTGKSALSALAGTAAGLVIGAALLLAVGTSTSVLWGLLPVAVLVAAYAPRAISFAAGQAGFTVVLFILFNIIAPTGYKVGLIRIEDVAIGFAVSVGVGLVFWPRGAAALLRRDLGAAYARCADYVAVTASVLSGYGDTGLGDPGQAERSATAAVHQLDDAFRQYLAERSAKRADPGSVARLVTGASRLIRAGHSMASLNGLLADGARPPRAYGSELHGEVMDVRSWYVTLGETLASGGEVPEPEPEHPEDGLRLAQYLRDASASGEPGALHSALMVLWASQHLNLLRRLEAHLGAQAAEASGQLAPPVRAG